LHKLIHIRTQPRPALENLSRVFQHLFSAFPAGSAQFYPQEKVIPVFFTASPQAYPHATATEWQNGIVTGFARPPPVRLAHEHRLIPCFSRAYTGVFRHLYRCFSTSLSTGQKGG
jgi:hypothetical protein